MPNQFKGNKLSDREAQAASLWASNFTIEQVQRIMGFKYPSAVHNILDRCRMKCGQAHMRNAEFRTWLQTHNWPQCWWCRQPATIEDGGVTPIHRATGSFLCHYEPNELPPGQPYCDCMNPACEAIAERWRAVNH